MEKFEVTILGCGSALPTTRHNGSAQILNVREKYFLIDCAEGTQLQLRRHHVQLNRMNHIFISHLHGDHCFGLIGLISTQGLLGRIAPLHIYGPEDIEKVFRPQIDYFCQPHLSFPVEFHPISSKEGGCIYEDRSVCVYNIPLRHRVPCNGFLFKEQPLLPHIRRDAIECYHIPVSQINNIKAGMDYTLEDGTVVPNEQLTTPSAPPRSYAYCTDTVYLPHIAQQMEGVDLLYHEATFSKEDEYLSQKVFHSTTHQAAMIARKAGAKQLMIGHFSTRYDDEQLLLDEAKEIFPNTLLAREGLTCSL